MQRSAPRACSAGDQAGQEHITDKFMCGFSGYGVLCAQIQHERQIRKSEAGIGTSLYVINVIIKPAERGGDVAAGASLSV